MEEIANRYSLASQRSGQIAKAEGDKEGQDKSESVIGKKITKAVQKEKAPTTRKSPRTKKEKAE